MLFASCRDMPDDKAPPSNPPRTPDAISEDDEVTRISPATGPLGKSSTSGASAASAAPSTSPSTPTPDARPATSLLSPTLPGGTAQRSNGSRIVTETLPGGASAGPTVRQVGRYQIVERIGRGGMATVYRAHDPSIGRDVAIKFLHATLSEDEEYRDRFLQEARAAGGLSHPNIVIVHDVGEIEGRPYMAMELLDGDTLADVMSNGQPMPVRDVVIMGIQLARALDYAHSRGIVHRDIKPGNLMCLRGSQTVKVTDFGIAHVETAGKEQRTRVGDVLGTPQYMSPEQAAGEKLDGRSDLFSSGIMFYQMLTGQRPFVGDSLVALAVKIAKEEPVPIAKLRPDLPASLRRVVERCLAKLPERRFQTGKELSDALSRVLVEIDAAALEKDKPRIVPLRVKWAATMALIVAIVMAVAGTVITSRQQAALMEQVIDSGAALSRFIAAQNAASALLDEWEAVDVSVQSMMKTGDFQSITLVDTAGVVRATSQQELKGKAYQPPQGKALAQRDGGLVVTRYQAQGEPVLGFETPITYAGKAAGRVALGLTERPLLQVARLSITLMVVLALITIAAVAIAMYFVANWFAQPIKLLGESMAEIAKGRFDHRIREQRKDEFGLLYAAFDQMAQALNDREAGAGATLTSIQRASTAALPADRPIDAAAEPADDTAPEVRT
jgi:serine/threonine protein kinase/HAMP domain-containing protein